MQVMLRGIMTRAPKGAKTPHPPKIEGEWVEVPDAHVLSLLADDLVMRYPEHEEAIRAGLRDLTGDDPARSA